MSEASATSQPAVTATRNPWSVGLVAIGGAAWAVAFMLWLVHSAVTDNLAYDVANASALVEWISLLIISGVVAFVGATVIAGVRHELREHDESHGRRA